MYKFTTNSPALLYKKADTMSERLKNRMSINDQIKMLARLAQRLDSDPRHPVDVITNYFNMDGEDHRLFMKEYRKEGDDPLEV